MALSGHLFADDPRWGVKSESNLKAGQVVAVTESSSELAKNRRWPRRFWAPSENCPSRGLSPMSRRWPMRPSNWISLGCSAASM